MKKTMGFASLLSVLLLIAFQSKSQTNSLSPDEPYRPLIHFTPPTGWMNDPNGLVYDQGVYQLFYQYYPNKTVWGPMHWGHATSTDMIHWQRQPIALYPDSLGYIFSGSAIVDQNNTSGFGTKEHPPLVAIFTHHDPKGEGKRNDYQNQSLAYSLDNGKSWVKYKNNPVLRNPGITDFRDPKVFWYEPLKKWIMTLAVKDHISFYSSPDLKQWKKESDFGKTIGAHGGVWECPDLFTLADAANGNKQVWILIVNINPGGPNKGSATQYFIGDFNGHKFAPRDTLARWLDYGPDEYAGVTWSNTGERKIFLGWMSNWLYGQAVPTQSWRSAMTVPRELRLAHAGNKLLVASMPVNELSTIESNARHMDSTGKIQFPCRLHIALDNLNDFSITISNKQGEKLVIGYDNKEKQYYIDRTHSGKTDFQPDFAGRHVAPRLTGNPKANLILLFDVSSVELFADDGLTVMTEIFFPDQPYDQLHLSSSGKMVVDQLQLIPLRSIWK